MIPYQEKSMNIENKKVQEIVDAVSECDEMRNGMQNRLSSFVIVFAAVVPTLLRIMERIDPKDEDVQYLINLFERNGFNFTQFKKKAEQISNENPDATEHEIEKKEDDFVLHETESFANVIRRAYDAVDS